MAEKIRNLNLIHPLNRERVRQLAEYLLDNQDVTRIFIFGSSVTSACHNDSDVDIYVELSGNQKEYHNPLRECPYRIPYDIWTNQTIDDRLYSEVAAKGVMVYERGDLVEQGQREL